MSNKKYPTAGQPKKFGEKTATVSIRVPESKKDHYKKVFNYFVASKELKDVSEINEIILQ